MPALFRSSLEGAILPGWVGKESITLLLEDRGANVIFSSEPLPVGMDTQRYVDSQGDLLQSEFDNYRELAFYPELIFGGRPGFIREFEWTPKTSGPVTQIQYYYTVPGRGYTATATTPTASLEEYGEQLRLILSSLTIREV